MKKFFEIFKIDNTWNEKTIIGFLSFAVMILVMIADVVTGAIGKSLPINEFTYNSFVYITLGSLGLLAWRSLLKNERDRFKTIGCKFL